MTTESVGKRLVFFVHIWKFEPEKANWFFYYEKNNTKFNCETNNHTITSFLYTVDCTTKSVLIFTRYTFHNLNSVSICINRCQVGRFLSFWISNFIHLYSFKFILSLKQLCWVKLTKKPHTNNSFSANY